MNARFTNGNKTATVDTNTDSFVVSMFIDGRVISKTNMNTREGAINMAESFIHEVLNEQTGNPVLLNEVV